MELGVRALLHAAEGHRGEQTSINAGKMFRRRRAAILNAVLLMGGGAVMEVGVHGVHALLHAEGEHRQEAKRGHAQILYPHVAGQDAQAPAQILKLKAAIHNPAATLML